MKKHYKALPNKVVVNGHTWKIVTRPMLEDTILGDAYGYTLRSGATTIVLRDNMPKALLKETLVHELQHVMVFSQGVVGRFQVPERDEEEDYTGYFSRWQHAFIELTSNALVLMIMGNPKLVKFLNS